MIVEQNSELNFYVTFLDFLGEAASISGTPTISVFHRQGASTKTDINANNLTQLNETTYYLKWRPSARAYKGTYVAKYSATYNDGTDVLGEESFQIVDRAHYGKNVGGLVLKGKGTTAAEPIWSENEKNKVFEILDGLILKISSIDGLDKNLSERLSGLSEIDSRLMGSLEKQNDSMSKITFLVDKLQKKKPFVNKFDDSKIIAEMNNLKTCIAEFKNLNEELRIPRIISELEEIRMGLENFQHDLIKVLPLTSLEKGVGLNEKVR